MAYDAGGQPTTSPAEAIKGAIRSFDRGYKGSGLAMIGEILAGPLVGAAFCGQGDSKGNWGHLIFAIDPDLLGDRDEFLANVNRVIGKVKSIRRLPGVDEILVPGERGSRTARECLEGRRYSATACTGPLALGAFCCTLRSAQRALSIMR
jgi:LDH2 family malate/lactate/ureidoglycolate dehydrogenase